MYCLSNGVIDPRVRAAADSSESRLNVVKSSGNKPKDFQEPSQTNSQRSVILLLSRLKLPIATTNAYLRLIKVSITHKPNTTWRQNLHSNVLAKCSDPLQGNKYTTHVYGDITVQVLYLLPWRGPEHLAITLVFAVHCLHCFPCS